jgi:hypothetical protein
MSKIWLLLFEAAFKKEASRAPTYIWILFNPGKPETMNAPDRHPTNGAIKVKGRVINQ